MRAHANHDTHAYVHTLTSMTIQIVILMVLLQRVAEGRIRNAPMAPRKGAFHQVLRLRGGKKRPLDWDPRGQKEIFGHDDDEVDLEDPDFKGVFGYALHPCSAEMKGKGGDRRQGLVGEERGAKNAVCAAGYVGVV